MHEDMSALILPARRLAVGPEAELIGSISRLAKHTPERFYCSDDLIPNPRPTERRGLLPAHRYLASASAGRVKLGQPLTYHFEDLHDDEGPIGSWSIDFLRQNIPSRDLLRGEPGADEAALAALPEDLLAEQLQRMTQSLEFTLFVPAHTEVDAEPGEDSIRLGAEMLCQQMKSRIGANERYTFGFISAVHGSDEAQILVTTTHRISLG